MPREYTTTPAPQRFWTKVDFNGPVPECRPELGPCWLWTGSRTPLGYGHFRISSTEEGYVHRWAYEFCVGSIPEGLTIDHLCRVRNCVNSDHLEPVTQAENVRRSPIALAAINIRKTHCLRGHLYDEENTYYHPSGKRRTCRTCRRERRRRINRVKVENHIYLRALAVG